VEFEAECIAGLERFAIAELAAVGHQRTPSQPSPPSLGVHWTPALRAHGVPSSPRNAYHGAPSSPLPSQGEGRGEGPLRYPRAQDRLPGGGGSYRFSYDGPWPALLGLRTVVAVHAILERGLPRPAALLDDGGFRRIAAGIGHIRSLHPSGAFRTFRLSAAGADSSVFQRFGARLGQATGLKPDDAGDLLLRVRRGTDGRFELLARISPRPLSTRAWRVCNRPGALNAAVASIMASLTRPVPDDVYVNLACGSGTLLVERAALGPAARLIGCDLDPEALDCAARNVEAATLSAAELTDWDATRLPLPDRSVDALTVDLPFGQLVGSHATNVELYPALLAEAARVARPGARLVAISQQSRLLERSIDAHQWAADEVLRPTLTTNAGPIKPAITVLRRTA
jgi:SAM-dependent methyltransferase